MNKLFNEYQFLKKQNQSTQETEGGMKFHSSIIMHIVLTDCVMRPYNDDQSNTPSMSTCKITVMQNNHNGNHSSDLTIDLDESVDKVEK